MSLFHTVQKPDWVNSLETYDIDTNIIQKIGYDPCIKVYPADNALNNASVTLYAHAWGDSQRTIDFLRRNSHFLPGTIIGFNFKDANFGSFLPDYKSSNFCQDQDIAVFALVLKLLDDIGIETFNLFGHSRGAGTILTTLARLNCYQKYKKFFRNLAITKEQALSILQKVHLGTIVLNCPLIDLDASIKDKLRVVKLDCLSYLIRHLILPFKTSYRPRHDCPLAAAKKLQKLHFNMLVFFQKNDLIVGNYADALFYKTIMGLNTHLIIGSDGEHVHTSKTLDSVLQVFNKQYGAAYYSESDFKKGQELFAQSQPTSDQVDKYIEDIYAQPTAPITNYDDAQKYAWQRSLEKYNMEPIIQTLGYNPTIKIYPADSAVKRTGVTIYVHGYGDNQGATIPFFQYNSYLLPGTVVGFDFQDVIAGTTFPNFKKSSVGQAADIATLLSVLKVLDECGLKKFHFFGYSRGGATVINMLARLCEYDKNRDFFSSLCISKKQSKKIFEKISAGTIILHCPLVDTHAVATHWFGPLGSWVLNTIIPSISEHRSDGDQALTAATTIQNMNFKLLVHFEYKDQIVGNEDDAIFYKNIMGKHTYLILADEGGHLNQGHTIGKAIQAFRKKYSGPYYPYSELIQEGNDLLALGQPTSEMADSYVAEMYAHYSNNKTITKTTA